MIDKRELKCFDICCGAGVFSFGFRGAGFNILGGIDIDKYAMETAKYNISGGAWEHLSIEELVLQVENDHNHFIFAADVILAGLPCQGFSIAGKCNTEDYRNVLYKHLMRIVRRVKPKFVVIENVQGLLSARYRDVLSNILDCFKVLGYDVDYRLYEAENFGVPQYRKRVFIIASLDIPVGYVFENVHFSDIHGTVKKALKGLPRKREIKNLNHTFMSHSKKVIRKISKIRGAGLISYRRLQLDKPSVTVTSGHNALPVHPTEHRAISNREAARLQGIPDTFMFRGPRSEQTVQVANAVPYPMANIIAKAIRNSSKLFESTTGKLYKKLTPKIDSNTKKQFKNGFVNFYKNSGRAYPWRNITDPYKILLTEILLQRTKSDMVKGVWKEIMASTKLSKSGSQVDPARIKRYIKKLGIFNRADTIKNLNNALLRYFGKKVPKNFDELMNLPGVGIYIAAAVRTFAFNIPDFPVDSNSFRFTSRFFGIKIFGRKSEARQIREFMNTIINQKRPKVFVYGFLDFCAVVCTPRKPKCDSCFLNKKCIYNTRRFRSDNANFEKNRFSNMFKIDRQTFPVSKIMPKKKQSAVCL